LFNFILENETHSRVFVAKSKHTSSVNFVRANEPTENPYLRSYDPKGAESEIHGSKLKLAVNLNFAHKSSIKCRWRPRSG